MRTCITALCPTYGRFELLRDAVACFLLQTYRPRRLLVLNDAPKPLRLSEQGNTLQIPGATLHVWNAESRYETLGHKRQALLTAADSEYVAHWDDDDWYLPWHLQQCVDALTSLRGAEGDEAISLSEAADAGRPLCVKPKGAWWVRGHRDSVTAEGPAHNVFEGQMAFDRRAALELGGYSLQDSGQAKDLMGRFKNRGMFRRFEPNLISYCYRWGHGASHISAAGDGECWAAGNMDFGGDEALIPVDGDEKREYPVNIFRWARDRMHPPWLHLLNELGQRVSRVPYDRIQAAFRAASGAGNHISDSAPVGGCNPDSGPRRG